MFLDCPFLSGDDTKQAGLLALHHTNDSSLSTSWYLIYRLYFNEADVIIIYICFLVCLFQIVIKVGAKLMY